MAPPIKILEAVWGFGHLRLVFPNKEEREKAFQAEFKIYKRDFLIAEGLVNQFIPDPGDSCVPYEVEGSEECGLFLAIHSHVESGREGYVMDVGIVDTFNPYAWDGTHKMVMFYQGQEFPVKMSHNTKKFAKHFGLPIPPDAT